jgi:hypothetical protein
MNHDSPTSSTLQDLIHAEREIPTLPREQTVRMFDRLAAQLPLPAASTVSQAPVESAIAQAGLRTKVFGLGCLLLGGLGGAAATRALVPSSNSTTSNPVVTRVEIVIHTASAEAVPPSAPPEIQATASSSNPRNHSNPPKKQEPPKVSNDLKRERLLLETARAALQRQDSASAKAALDEHARAFPNGQLSEERTILLRAADAIRP